MKTNDPLTNIMIGGDEISRWCEDKHAIALGSELGKDIDLSEQCDHIR